MNRRGIENPNEVLASPNTALGAGARLLAARACKRARHSTSKSARHPKATPPACAAACCWKRGLSEAAVLGGQIRYGHEAVIAQGAILVDPSRGRGQELSAGHAGSCPQRRRRHQVAQVRPHPRPRAPIHPPQPDGGQGRQRAISHVCRRPAHGRCDAEDRRVHRSYASSALQEQRRPIHARDPQHRDPGIARTAACAARAAA